MSAMIVFDGNLTRDPEIRQVGVNNVCNYTVAVNTGVRKEDGTYETSYFDCSTWGTSGDYVFGKIKQGTEVTVCGELSVLKKPDANGVEHTRLRVKTYSVKARRGARDAKPRETVETPATTAASDDPTE